MTLVELLKACKSQAEGTEVYVALPTGEWVRARAAKVRPDPWANRGERFRKVFVIEPDLRLSTLKRQVEGK